MEFKTKANMGVKDTNLLIRAVSKDVPKLQFLREYFQNISENAERNNLPKIHGFIGKKVINIDGTLVDKLFIADDGTGMTQEEMDNYMMLAATGNTSNKNLKNYGIGAKISAIVHNKLIIYVSWKDGVRSQVAIGVLGVGDERVFPVLEAPDIPELFEKPVDARGNPIIKEHGTVVYFFGKELLEDTWLALRDPVLGTKTYARYLNHRFFEVPSNVTFSVLEGSEQNTRTRTIRGINPFIQERIKTKGGKKLQGKLDLGDAIVHWAILESGRPADTHSGSFYLENFVSLLYQGELYGVKYGQSGAAELRKFGVTHGSKDVALLVEPRVARINLVRSALTAGDDEGEMLLPAKWAEAFYRNMPAAIFDHIEESRPKTERCTDLIKRILANLKYFRLRRYLPNAALAETNSDTIVNVFEPVKVPDKGGSDEKNDGGTTTKIERRKAPRAARMAENSNLKAAMPSITWISIKNGTRSSDDMPYDMARYEKNNNEITANEDFGMLVDVVESICEEWPNLDKSEVLQVVKGVIAEHLIISTMRIMVYTRVWGKERVDKLFDESIGVYSAMAANLFLIRPVAVMRLKSKISLPKVKERT